MTGVIEWDFFIAHAGADKGLAEQLFDLLSPTTRAFLDSRCVEPGDDWDAKLAGAQRASLITVVLVSTNTGNAYYQREEIAAAIDLARTKQGGHRLVPLYLDAAARDGDALPYGLRLKHGLTLTAEYSLSD